MLLRPVSVALRVPSLSGALVAVLLLTSCRSAPPPPPPVSNDTWATVDGQAITRDEVDKAFRRTDQSRALSNEEALTVKMGILDDLITQKILLGRATSLKVVVSEADLDKAFADARKDVPDAAFEQQLKDRNLTAADIREGIRRDLVTQKVLEQEVGAKVTVTDQEVADAFTANRAQFNLAEDAYRLAQIVVTPVRDPQVANRTGDDATTPQAAAAKLQMLMERLKGGAAFGDLAMDFSEDPDSAPRGGDLGLVPVSAIRQAPRALRDAALNATPGSARVASQDGVHTIVFVLARETAGQRELTTPGVKEQITAAIRGRRQQLLRTAYLTAARTDAEVVNYQARRVVEARGTAPATPAAAAP